MKTIHIRFAEILNGEDARTVAGLLDKITAIHKIDQVNWPDAFPDGPDTSFRTACSADTLFIRFLSKEMNIRALYLNDQEPVWEDSCVEFFCRIPGSETYMNFEFNCIGTCLASSRKSRNEGVVPFISEQLTQIDRYASLERKIYDQQEGLTRWELTVGIPFSLLGLSPDEKPEYLEVNFYKCGDGTSSPHYLSWNRINTPSPDFHCPEFFGRMVF